MCGIAGWVADTPGSPSEIEEIVIAMGTAQRNRGPDALYHWSNERVGLSTVRLGIVGSAGRSKQPFVGENGRRMICNGELYSPRETMADLGSDFQDDDCDGIALLKMLEKKGVHGLREVEAMFGLALLEPDGSVLLARDAWGQKPLFVCRRDGHWAFASTMAAMHQALGPLQIRPEAMMECLIYKSIGGLGSSFQGIRQVAPGGWMRLKPDGTSEEGVWFQWPDMDDRLATPSHVRQLLETSITQRCPTDIPSAIFLSGGLDSGIVASVATAECKRLGLSLPHVFTVGYETGGWRDEHDLAVQQAKELGLEHTAITVKAEDVPGLMRDAAVALEDSIHDPVTVPTLALCRAAAADFRVVLTGDGSDEFWGGYARFDDVPANLTEYLERTSIFDYRELGLTGSPASYLEGVPVPDTSLSPLDRVLRLEASNRMRNYHLSRVDKLSMSCSLEARSPFVDLRVTQGAVSYSASIKRPGGKPKGLLIAAFRDQLPQWLVERRKQPFTVPVQAWLSGKLNSFVNDTLTGNSFVSQWVDPLAYLEKFRKVAKDGGSDERFETALAMKIWSLLHLEIWYQSFGRQMEDRP
ncbi:MAG: asparagine synthetase B [Mariniblastus sp.]|nr:asparagine synthetase B [Mariniblastus sp.]